MKGAVRSVPLQELKTQVGQELGVSGWYTLDQTKIQAFADLTDDHMFLHVDEPRAKATPFGSTIAHGFFTLSMVAAMAYQVVPSVEGVRMGVNYGLNKVRFISAVKSGKRVRGRFKLKALDTLPDGRAQITNDVTVEIEGETKPALAAEWITMVWL